MTAGENEKGFDTTFQCYAELCVLFWRCAAVIGGARLTGAESSWALQRPSDDSLVALGRTMDRYMRSPAFLYVMQRSLWLMNGPHARALRAHFLSGESKCPTPLRNSHPVP
jgi:hypothetical protein